MRTAVHGSSLTDLRHLLGIADEPPDTLGRLTLELIQPFRAYAIVSPSAPVYVAQGGPHFARFCRLLRRLDGGETCTQCDLRWGERVGRTRRPAVYMCDAGLLDGAVPVFAFGEPLVTLFFGQHRFAAEEDLAKGRLRLAKITGRFPRHADRLIELWEERPSTSRPTARVVIKRLSYLALYLQMLAERHLENDELAAQLNTQAEATDLALDMPSASAAAAAFSVVRQVSHDAKNLLAGVQGQLQALAVRDKLPRQDDMRAQLSRLAYEIRRGASTFGDFLQYIHDVAAQKPKPFRVCDAVKRAAHICQPRMDRRVIKVVTELPVPGPVIRGREMDLVLVMANLLINAANAIDRVNAIDRGSAMYGADSGDGMEPVARPGRIEICVKDFGRGVEISVRDNGCGITREERQDLFQPLRTGRASGPWSTGMGLFQSQALIEAMGGKISVQSRVGRESRFVIRLSTPYRTVGDEH